MIGVHTCPFVAQMNKGRPGGAGSRGYRDGGWTGAATAREAHPSPIPQPLSPTLVSVCSAAVGAADLTVCEARMRRGMERETVQQRDVIGIDAVPERRSVRE